ncbi:hypothetical protein A5866_002775 [Enterococcus sp. 12C11_DIV0727]|uniref:Transposase n=1 Tax=Candidatus Enterococcus lemimoniae TaxID=1834167 RepID=A0ABZ2T8E3_9ENTE|nr:hypothetical protein A5866_002663 [Enterococcus sp. 12C11_DIV0727]
MNIFEVSESQITCNIMLEEKISSATNTIRRISFEI